MKTAVVAVLGALVCISLAAFPAQAAPTTFKDAQFSHPLTIDNPYFPLTAGTTMIYNGTSEGNPTHEELVVTHDTELVAGIQARVVHDTNWESGQLVEDTFDWYAQDDAGNVWYLGEDSTQYENGVVVGHEGSWRAGTDGAQPGIIMEANPQVGDTYRQEYARKVAQDAASVISLDASICVPYGCFTDVLQTKETTKLERGVVENKYYAQGVGEIKSTVVQGGSEENNLVQVVHQ